MCGEITRGDAARVESGDKPTVLLVEDEERLRELYGGWLSKAHRVVTARNATEALDVFDDSIDVVLLDRRMPDASSDDVLAEMRSSETDVRIAMVTAVEPTDDVVKCFGGKPRGIRLEPLGKSRLRRVSV